MLPALLAVAPEALEALAGLATAYFGVSAYHKFKENTDFGVSVSDSVIPLTYSNDYTLTKPSNSMNLDSVFNNQKEVSLVSNPDENVVVSDSVADKIVKQNLISETKEVKFNPVQVKFDEKSLEVQNSTTLIDVLKNNGSVLAQSMSSINQNLASQVQVQVFQAQSIAYAISQFQELFSKLLELMISQNIYLKSISNSLTKINDGSNIASYIDMLKSVIDEKDFVNKVNVDTQAIADVFEGIKTDINTIAQAKELEKENYEYMKTPQTYSLSADEVPSLAPRDVIALSEAIKAHLNSQEATLDGSELEDIESDFDTSDVLAKLFNFIGITNDVKKLGGSDGS